MIFIDFWLFEFWLMFYYRGIGKAYETVHICLFSLFSNVDHIMREIRQKFVLVSVVRTWERSPGWKLKERDWWISGIWNRLLSSLSGQTKSKWLYKLWYSKVPNEDPLHNVLNPHYYLGPCYFFPFSITVERMAHVWIRIYELEFWMHQSKMTNP